MDLGLPGRAAGAATCGVAAALTIRCLVAFGEFGPVDHDRYLYAGARPAAAAATAVADFFLRLANPGSGWSRGWTSGAGASGRDQWGLGAIAGLLRTAAGAPLTLIATPTRARGPPRRRRPRSPISFCVWRIPDPAGAGDGPRAAGATGRDQWGLGAIAGLLRTAAGGLRRALYPLTWCSGSGARRPAPAAMELEDGPRAAGASGRGGHLRGRRPVDHPMPCCVWRIRPR